MYTHTNIFSCFMKKTIVSIGLAILACLFLFTFSTGIASAQEEGATNTDTATPELISEEGVVDEETVEVEEELPSDVLLDERVTTEDLGAVEASVLPGSPLHIFKRFGWAVQEIFETDPVADAELKIQHANQELSELKQLIDEKGFADVNPSTINASMSRFEGRLENVNNVADDLKERKESDPDAVNALLNNLTDKQFKYQKVLESIERDVIKEKEDNPDANNRVEDVFVQVSKTKDKTLEHFGKTLETVESNNPEKIAERIIRVADKQEGSEFKHLKNLEVLKRLEGQVPENAKGAIALAQENTLKFFNRDISALPEEARAGRFERYNRFNYGDETRQLSFLDDLKLLEDVPPEILQKIEEVKEFAITKFEKKMSRFNKSDVLDNYMEHLSGEDFDDMVLAEQFASRVVFEDNPEIKARMDSIRDKSVTEFTKRFTDPDSQAQVAKFQELERILEKRPGDPKVIKMMQELEAQVRSDPSKAEFLSQMDQLEDKMRFEFEAKFANEGDRYFDRIGTLDPRDFEVYQQFSGDDFLPEGFADKFLDHGVNQYRDYMRDVDNPEQFDRFNTKFGNVPQFVIDDIRGRDGGFGEAMQFKRQAMEKLRFEEERKMEIGRQAVDYSERELTHQLDRARRQADEDFWQKVNSIPYENFEERKALFEEKRKADLARLEEENQARLEIFNKRLELDPWCDTACKQIQKQFIDQEFRHQKERIQDDYRSHQKQIEFDLGREKQNNPLFGKCSTPESCDTYCQTNPNAVGCQGFFHEPEPFFPDDFGPKDYDCGPGKYFDFEQDECRVDPYYKPPTDFTQCPFGSHWNPNKGFCERDFIKDPIYKPNPVNTPDCGFDAYFDFKENKCISYKIDNICPDYSASFFAQCPDGEYREEYNDRNGCRIIGECRPFRDQSQCPDLALIDPLPCFAGQSRDIITDNNGCKVFSECRGDNLPVACPVFDLAQCPEGSYRDGGYKNADGCWVPGECVPDGNVTCTAYFEGYEYNTATNRCEFRSTSGCSNPYKYRSITECQEGNVTGAVPTYPTTSNWVNHTWYFSDGSTSSYILDRTDSEYSNYVSGIEAQCKTISQSSFGWKSDAGNDADWNWQNFGIPDCSGNAQPNTYPTYPTSGSDCGSYSDSGSCTSQDSCYWYSDSSTSYCYYDSGSYNTGSTYVGDSGCSDILDILPGCHLMSESPDVRFNTNMDQYIQLGTRNIQYCSTNSIPGCTGSYSNNYGYCGDNVCNAGEDTYNCSSDCGSSGTNTGTNAMQKCFYPNATINGAPTGYTVWCESDYYNCHQGDPSGATVSLSNLSLGAPSSCESGYDNSGSTNTGTTSGGYCGDNVCDYNESPSSCQSDCGGSTYVGDSGCEDLLDILPGCHLMSESPDVRFNTNMDQYVQVGTRNIQYCSSNSIPGCMSSYNNTDTTYCPPPSYWDPAISGCNYDSTTTDTSSTYCTPPAYWDPAINGCNWDSSTTNTSSCPSTDSWTCPSGYEYDSNGCVSGCLPDYTAPVCPDLGLTCDSGYEYDGSGCVTGCIPPPAETYEPPPAYEPPPDEAPPADEPPPAANIFEAFKALFGL